MYPSNSAFDKTPDAWTTPSLTTLHRCGLEAGQALDGEQRYLALRQLATQSNENQRDQTRAPRKWRQWSGELLVRAGQRLHGVAVSTGPHIPSETH